ncbi:MAG: LPS-assembly protein [Saprospiraceae bacterium]
MPYISMKKPLQTSLFLLSLAFSAPVLAATDDVSIGFTDETACPSPRIDLPQMLIDAPSGPIGDQETIIEGDEISSDNSGDGDLVVLTGNSQIVQGRRGVFADKIVYDADNYQATADGNVRFYTVNGDEIKTERMRLEVDTFIGDTGPGEMRLVKRDGIVKRKVKQFFEDFSIFAPFFNRGEQEEGETDDRPIVGTRVYADQIDMEGKDFQRLTNARITSCPEGNDDVMIVGKEVELDHAAGVGYVKNVSVKFKGVPILYAPRLSFPLNDERKSGVLTPSVGSDDDSGTQFSVPYYFNLAPHYDATVRGTYMSKRGVQLFGEFRHMTETGNGVLKGEYLPGDDAYNGEDRYAVGLDYQNSYSNGWRSLVDLQDVSDTEYLNDFRNDIELTSTTHLRQRGEVSYSNQFMNANILASKYKTVNNAFTSSKPYDRLPQVTFSVEPWSTGPVEVGLDSEFVSFAHNDNTRVSGTRLNVEPYITMPYEPIYGFVKPKLSLKSLSYSLDNALGDDNPSITVPKAVIDAGIYLERDMVFGGEEYLHTLEPRMMYVNVGEEDQTGFPNFDTGEGSVNSFSYLFRDDRFFGGDRIGDDQHIALGVTTRLIYEETGKEKMSASIGQLYYLEDRTVTLGSADNESLTESRSDIFAQVDAQLTDEFSVDSFLRYDVSDGATSNFNMGLDYNGGLRRKASVDYFLTKDRSEDVRLALSWPLTPHLQLGFSQRYSLEESQERDSSIKLVYDSCCWAIGLSVNRLLQSDGDFRNSILATFELDGLGRIQSTAQ